MSIIIPSCTFHLHPINITTIIGGRFVRINHFQGELILDDEAKLKLINSNTIFSSEILFCSRDERLGEDKFVYPVDSWFSIFHPSINKDNSIKKIFIPSG